MLKELFRRSSSSAKPPGRVHGLILAKGDWGARAILYTPETVRHLLNRKSGLAKRHPMVSTALKSALGGNVMLAANGNGWKKTRDATNKFFTPKYVRDNHLPETGKIAAETFAEIASQASAQPDGQISINVEKCMRELTLRIAGHVLLGRTLSTVEAKDLEARLDRASNMTGDLFVERLNRNLAKAFQLSKLSRFQPVYFPKGQRDALKSVSEWLEEKINRLEKNKDGDASLVPESNETTFLQSLQARYSELKPAASKKAVVAECMLFLFAGVETTASALSFAVFETATHDKVNEKISTEAFHTPLAPGGHVPRPENMAYAARVFNETLRMHSIVRALARVAGKNDEIGGTHVPAGTLYNIFLFKFHKDRKVWSEPDAFDPDRFERLTQRQKDNFMPFGAGPQICSGLSLATMQGAVILSTFFRQLTVEKVDGEHGAIRSNILDVARPNGPITAVVRSRNAAVARI